MLLINEVLVATEATKNSIKLELLDIFHSVCFTVQYIIQME